MSNDEKNLEFMKGFTVGVTLMWLIVFAMLSFKYLD